MEEGSYLQPRAIAAVAAENELSQLPFLLLLGALLRFTSTGILTSPVRQEPRHCGSARALSRRELDQSASLSFASLAHLSLRLCKVRAGHVYQNSQLMPLGAHFHLIRMGLGCFLHSIALARLGNLRLDCDQKIRGVPSGDRLIHRIEFSVNIVF